ncbi:hypothetical protein AB1K18_12665 [Peribacillus simplex]
MNAIKLLLLVPLIGFLGLLPELSISTNFMKIEKVVQQPSTKRYVCEI